MEAGYTEARVARVFNSRDERFRVRYPLYEAYLCQQGLTSSGSLINRLISILCLYIALEKKTSKSLPCNSKYGESHRITLSQGTKVKVQLD